jgi:DNA-binding beta-propeller fold protein YncE
VYVTDTGNNRIQKFNSNGNFITKWGSFCHLYNSKNCNTHAIGAQTAGDGQFDEPRGIALDSSGNVYVTETGNNQTGNDSKPLL